MKKFCHFRLIKFRSDYKSLENNRLVKHLFLMSQTAQRQERRQWRKFMAREVFKPLPWSIKVFSYNLTKALECRSKFAFFPWPDLFRSNRSVPWMTSISLGKVNFGVFFLFLTKQSQIKRWRMKLLILRNRKVISAFKAAMFAFGFEFSAIFMTQLLPNVYLSISIENSPQNVWMR